MNTITRRQENRNTTILLFTTFVNYYIASLTIVLYALSLRN